MRWAHEVATVSTDLVHVSWGFWGVRQYEETKAAMNRPSPCVTLK